MTIENLKQIAIKYATAKGSRVPLAPDELCNAVVQYFNEFLKITADINTIQVAVTEEGGNIVFTITGNTLDGKAFTPIVITVDHNDFVTNQEFEEFKTSVTKQLNNKLNKITSPMSNFVLYANIEGNDTQISYDSGPATNTILYRDETGKTAVVKGVSGQDVANMENLSDITAKIPDVSGFATKEELQNVQNSLNNKRSVISSPASSYVVYTQANGLESNLPYSELANQTSTNIMARRANGTSDVKKGISGENVANMENLSDITAKIPDVSGFATKEELQNVQNSLNNKRSVISSPASSYVVYTQANGLESNLPYSELANQTSTNIMARRANGTSDVKKGISGENVANMENIADLEEKIPSTDNFLLKNVVNIINYSKFKIVDEIGSNIIGKADSSNNMSVGASNYAMQLNSSIRPIIYTPDATYNVAYTSDIPEYTNVDSVSYDTTNGAIVAYDGANEIHIPLLAGENVTIDASEDNKKIVISAAGGGGAGDVTAAGNNIFTGENEFRNYTYDTSYFCFVDTKEDYLTNGYTTTIKNGGFDIAYYENGEGKYWTIYADNQIINKDIDMEGEVVIKFPKKEGTFALTSDIPDTSSFVTLAGDNTFGGTNTFNNSIYAKNGVVAGDTTNYGANSVTKGSNTYSFPNKSGTFAMTTDVIKDTIYFISFYANELSEPCHLIGTMMSKNSYGTGQKTNEEFAVMLADNLYTNSNEGLAVYGKLAGNDILCIYSEDGLSIRCLNEANSEVDLPMVMFFITETEL